MMPRNGRGESRKSTLRVARLAAAANVEACMAGLHFSCGRWMGGDKTANPLFDIIEKALPKYLADGEEADFEQFLRELDEQADEEEINLTPEMMRAIIGPLERYHDALVKKLGLSGPQASLEELGKYPRTMSKAELHVHCIRDLLAGNRVCQRTKKPIKVIFA